MSDTSTKAALLPAVLRHYLMLMTWKNLKSQAQSSTAVTKVKKLTKRSPKKTNIKFQSRRNSKPKSQSEAMVQVAKSIENSSVQQEQNKDARLKALLEGDRKRDEMFLAYQREQATSQARAFYLRWAAAKTLVQAGHVGLYDFIA